jgi:hypothetical protein
MAQHPNSEKFCPMKSKPTSKQVMQKGRNRRNFEMENDKIRGKKRKQ